MNVGVYDGGRRGKQLDEAGEGGGRRGGLTEGPGHQGQQGRHHGLKNRQRNLDRISQ